MTTDRTGQRIVRVVDWLGGGPGAVANAAGAVQRDTLAAHQRQQAWAATRGTTLPAADGNRQGTSGR